MDVATREVVVVTLVMQILNKYELSHSTETEENWSFACESLVNAVVGPTATLASSLNMQHWERSYHKLLESDIFIVFDMVEAFKKCL